MCKQQKVLIAAIIDNELGKPSEINLEKDGVKIKLTAEDWQEILDTLKGGRTNCFSALESGEYFPRYSYVFNYVRD